jgi:hypothetical protein
MFQVTVEENSKEKLPNLFTEKKKEIPSKNFLITALRKSTRRIIHEGSLFFYTSKKLALYKQQH